MVVVSGKSHAIIRDSEAKVEKDAVVNVYGKGYVLAKDNATVILHDTAIAFVKKDSNVKVKSSDLVIEVPDEMSFKKFYNLKNGKVFYPGKCEI